MSDAPLTCPHCSTRLRVRDRIHIGRSIPCPDCEQPLLVIDTPEGLSVTRGNAEGATTDAKSASAATTATDGRARLRPSRVPHDAAQQELRHPARAANQAQLIAWTAAGLIAVAAAAVLFWPRSKPDGWLESNEVNPQPGANGGLASDSTPANQSERDPGARLRLDRGHPSSDDGVTTAVDSPPRAPLQTQLAALGRDLTGVADKDEAFPIGTFSTADQPLGPDERFSWIAVLEAENPPPGGRWDVRWDRPWRDPHHEAFVRRRVSRWQNPLVPKLAGDDGYPATHFVGVAGVGEDAPRLPNGHPRVGVFGDERQTRLDDIADGASETILLAGVAGRLGSWAAGGSATVRPFTRGPFVNGPDGFGTGQANSMFVLMADGSVRTISADIDDDIVQRLVTINESTGSPDKTEPRVAGVERSEPPANRNQPADGAADSASAPPTPEKLPPAPAKPIDIDAALRQPLLRFEQTQPVPLSQMLKQLEALLGAPIRIDDEHRKQIEPKLTTPVKVKLQRTTVSHVLRDVLHQAGLTFRQDRECLVAVPDDS
jgi:hypothetical protein